MAFKFTRKDSTQQKTEPTPGVKIPARQQVQNYSKSADALLNKIIEKQAKKNDPSVSLDRFNKTYINYKGQVDSYYKDVAGKSYEERTGKTATSEILADEFKRQQGSFSYYNQLVNQAKELDVKIDDTTDHRRYLGEYIKKTTPKEEEFSVYDTFVRPFVDTSIGAGLILKDAFSDTNSYDKYFYKEENPETTGTLSKTYDLLFKQGAVIDAIIGGLNLLPGVGNMMSAGLFSLKGGIKGITKKGLKKAAKFGRKRLLLNAAGKSKIDQILAIEGKEAFAKAVAKEEEFITPLFKSPRRVRSGKVTMLNTIGDALDIPGIHIAGELIDKPGGKIGVAFSSGKLAVRGGLVGLGAVAPAAANLLTNGANEIAGITARHLQIGIVQKEREKFRKEHGIDPMESTGALRQSWEDHINYVTRTSGFTSTLTGYVPEKDAWLAKFGIGFVDGIANFATMGGTLKGFKGGAIKGWNKAFDISPDSKGAKVIEDILSGKKVGQGFLTEAKVIRALSEAQEKLRVQSDEITRTLNDVDRQTLLSKQGDIAEGIKTNDLESAAKAYQDVNRMLGEAGSLVKEDIKSMSDTSGKIKKLSEYLQKQNGTVSKLARWRQEASRNFFSSKAEGDISEIAIKTERSTMAIANEKLGRAINVPNKMVEIFENQKEISKKMESLFDSGKNINNIIEIRLKNVLDSNKFTEDQFTKIKNIIGPQLQAKIIRTGLIFSKFKNHSLNGIINEVLNDNFGIELSKKLSKTFSEKNKTAKDRGETVDTFQETINELRIEKEAKTDPVGRAINNLVNVHNLDLARYEKQLDAEIGKSKDFLQKKVLQVRGLDDIYSQWIAQNNKYKATNEIYQDRVIMENDYSTKDSNSKVITPEQLEPVAKKSAEEIEKNIKEDEVALKTAQDNVEKTTRELNDLYEIKQEEIKASRIIKEKKTEEQNWKDSPPDPNVVKLELDEKVFPDEITDNFTEAVENYRRVGTDKKAINKLEFEKLGIDIQNKSLLNIIGGKGAFNRTQLVEVIKKYKKENAGTKKALSEKDNKAITKWYLDSELTKPNIINLAKSSVDSAEFSRNLIQRLQKDYFLSEADAVSYVRQHYGVIRDKVAVEHMFLTADNKVDVKENEKQIKDSLRNQYQANGKAYSDSGINIKNLYSEQDYVNYSYNQILKRSDGVTTPKKIEKLIEIQEREIAYPGKIGTAFEWYRSLEPRNFVPVNITQVKTENAEGKAEYSYNVESDGKIVNQITSKEGKEIEQLAPESILDQRLKDDGQVISVNLLKPDPTDENIGSTFDGTREQEKVQKIIEPTIKNLAKKGFVYVGNFNPSKLNQLIFIKPKKALPEGTKPKDKAYEKARESYMMKAMGIDEAQFKPLDPIEQNRIIRNASKYLKLNAGHDVSMMKRNLNPEIYKDRAKIVGNENLDNQIHLLVKDEARILDTKDERGNDIKKIENPVHDGAALATKPIMDTYNQSVGNDLRENIAKTVSISEDGSFYVKSALYKINETNISEPAIVEALSTMAQKYELGELKTLLRNDLDYSLNRQKVVDYIDRTQVVDQIVFETALKQPFFKTQGTEEVGDTVMGKKRILPGEVFTVPTENFKFKRQSIFTPHPESSRVNVSQQLFQGIKPFSAEDLPLVEKIHNSFADQMINQFKELISDSKNVLGRGTDKMQKTLEKWDKYFTDKDRVLTGTNLKSITNTFAKLSGNAQRGLFNLKGQNLVSAPLMNYEKSIVEINDIGKKKFGNTFKENNFIVLERNAPLEKARDENNGRLFLHRNPSDGAGTFVMPFVFFRDEISSLGKTKIDGRVITTQEIAERKKLDYDRDPVSVITDEKFYKEKEAMQELSDRYWDEHGKGNFSGDVDAQVVTTKLTEDEISKMTPSEMQNYWMDVQAKSKDSVEQISAANKYLASVALIVKRDKINSGTGIGEPYPKYIIGGWDGLKKLNKTIGEFINGSVDLKGHTYEDLVSAVNKHLDPKAQLLHPNPRMNTENVFQLNQTYRWADEARQKELVEVNEELKPSNNTSDKTLKEMGGEIIITPDEFKVLHNGELVKGWNKRDTNVDFPKNEFSVNIEHKGKKHFFSLKKLTRPREQMLPLAAQKLYRAEQKSFRNSLPDLKDLKTVALESELSKVKRIPDAELQKNKHQSFTDHEFGTDVNIKRFNSFIDKKTDTSYHFKPKILEAMVEMAQRGDLDMPDFGINKNSFTGRAHTIIKDQYKYDREKFDYKNKNLEDMTRQQKFAFLINKANLFDKTKDIAIIKKRDQALLDARQIMRTVPEGELKSFTNYLISRWGLHEKLKSFFDENDINNYTRSVQLQIREQIKNPDNYEGVAKEVAENMNKAGHEFKKFYAEKVKGFEQAAKPILKGGVRFHRDIQSILKDANAAPLFKNFATIAKNAGLDLAKTNPEFAAFAHIGEDLIGKYNESIKNATDVMKEENVDVNTDLEMNTTQMRLSKNRAQKELNKGISDIEEKLQVKNVLRIIQDKSIDNTAKHQEITKSIANNMMKSLDKMLSENQRLVIGSEDFDSRNKANQKLLDNYIMKTGQKLDGLDMLKSVFDFTNKLYKSLNVGIAVGRVISEPIQAKGLHLVDNLNKGYYKVTNKVKFQGMIANEVPGGTMPIIGKFSTEFQNIQKSSLLLKHDKEMASKLFVAGIQKVKRVTNKVASVYTNRVGKIEQKFYEDDYMTGIWKRYNEMKVRGDDASILFKNDLSIGQARKKNNILSELRRKSEKKTAEVFFGNYNTHPLFVQKMEDVMPFTNFLYSGAKIINRYPKSILMASNMLMSLQNQFGEEQTVIDEDGNRIAVGKKWGFPMLGFLGFGNVAINTQRLLQVSPTEMAGSAYPILSYLTGTDDWRVRKYYQELADGVPNAFGWLMSDAISPTFRNISDFAHTGDVSELVNGLGYYATGFVMKDRTQSEMITDYFNGDYKKLLNYGDSQFAEFANNEKIHGDKKPTKKSIEALLFAEDLGLIGDKQNPYDKTMRIISKASLAHLPKETQNQDKLALKNGVDAILGKKIYGDKFDKNWLTKIATLFNSDYYEDFREIMPEYAKALDHYAEHFDYYDQLFTANEVAYGGKSSWEDKEDAHLTLTALRYKFRNEPDNISHISNLERKKQMIKKGTLNEVLYDAEDVPVLTSNYEAALDYKGPFVEAYAKGVAGAEAARNLKMVYMSLAETTASAKKKSGYWDKFQQQKNIQLGREAMLHDLISTDQESFVSKYGKQQTNAIAELYFLKRPDQKETASSGAPMKYSDRVEATKRWGEEIEEKKSTSLQLRIDNIIKLSEEEKEFFLSIGVDPSMSLYRLRKDVQAGKITLEQAEAVKGKTQLGNINF